MKKPEKIQRYEMMRELGLKLKPAVYQPIDMDKNRFIDMIVKLMDDFPIIMYRTAFDESTVPWAKRLSLPRRFDLKTVDELDKAYDELKDISAQTGFSNPWIMGWHFYPDKNLMSLNLMFDDEKRTVAELNYDVGHENTTQGIGRLISMEYNNCFWMIKTPGLEDKIFNRHGDKKFIKNIRKGILFEAIDFAQDYIKRQDIIESLKGDFKTIIIETITQYPIDLLKEKRHFAVDYTRL
ncbi:MAG: hypothetical protein MAG795_00063 [Candidatus Woesearchaeota archaeon]|nr:hypothetical protein [Candidatus Woesearchaeota archaeon]